MVRPGLAWEAAGRATYIADGHRDSPIHSMADSVSLALTMDTVRHQGQRQADML